MALYVHTGSIPWTSVVMAISPSLISSLLIFGAYDDSEKRQEALLPAVAWPSLKAM